MLAEMAGLGLAVGHLCGDHVLQTGWMARWKSGGPVAFSAYERERRLWIADGACFVHCLVYTLAVWACSFWWMTWCGLGVCFAVHFVIDRWGLAGRYSRNVVGPWPGGALFIDQSWHLLTLFLIGVFS